MTSTDRRDFLALGGASLAAVALTGLAGGQQPAAPNSPNGPSGGATLMRRLVPGAVDAAGAWVHSPLPYAEDALEPHIDAQTMRLHHGAHHLGYVNGLKRAEEEMAKARESGDHGLVEYWAGKVSFNAGGHVMHSIFWDCMGPNGGGEPGALLTRALERDFGTVDQFRAQFTALAVGVEGSGWGILGYQMASGRLALIQGKNQNLLSPWAFVPLLVIDVWEHAYYLKYQNRRAEYVRAWWNVVDWRRVEGRLAVLEAMGQEDR